MDDKRVLLLDGCRGIYVPQGFGECFDMDSWGVSDEDADILSDGPENEAYWDTWDAVIAEARYVDDTGYGWRLWQDGDLWAIREDYDGDEDDYI